MEKRTNFRTTHRWDGRANHAAAGIDVRAQAEQHRQMFARQQAEITASAPQVVVAPVPAMMTVPALNFISQLIDSMPRPTI